MLPSKREQLHGPDHHEPKPCPHQSWAHLKMYIKRTYFQNYIIHLLFYMVHEWVLTDYSINTIYGMYLSNN